VLYANDARFEFKHKKLYMYLKVKTGVLNERLREFDIFIEGQLISSMFTRENLLHLLCRMRSTLTNKTL